MAYADLGHAELASDHKTPDAIASSQAGRAGHMLERATWAARSFGTYTAADVSRIVQAVADAAADHAEEFARLAVDETGFGVVEHKVLKNLACSTGLLDEYAGHDYVTPRSDTARKMFEIPRPAGVVLALTPSTNPVATVYFKVILSLMTRNAAIVSPHPMAKNVCSAAAELLARAAVEAGAPDGVIQWVDEPTIPLVELMMKDERTGVVVATGGTGVVRAAYSSSTPALGVGPGNVPVLVDATADIRAAAREIVESKKFDNSVLCTNESVLIVEESVADELLREMVRAGAQLLDDDDTQLLAAYMFPAGRLNTDAVGKDAHVIAEKAGIKSGPKTKVLLAPIDVALPEEPMTHEKLSPVLGVLRVSNAEQGIAAARAVVRIAGAGHSAAIHSADSDVIMRFGASVPVLRISVNAGNSTGSSGLGTHLATTMTVGTGFIGRSGIGENLEPRHLINWTKVAYNVDDRVPMQDFSGLDPWERHDRPVPQYPVASNDRQAHMDTTDLIRDVSDRLVTRVGRTHPSRHDGTIIDDSLRREIRRLVAQELSNLNRG